MTSMMAPFGAWALWGLMGCGEVVDPGMDLKTPLPEVKKEEEKEEEKEEVAIYAYNPMGKRDPFQSFLGPETPTTPGGEDASNPPLQRWDVERYVVKGIIFGTDSPRALLVDPEGIGHVVRLGTYVGRSWGKVTAIADRLIVVTEEYKTPDDELVVNPVELRLGTGGAL